MNYHNNFSTRIMDFQPSPCRNKQTNKTSILGTLIHKGENKWIMKKKKDIFSICLRLQMSSQAFQGLAQCVFDATLEKFYYQLEIYLCQKSTMNHVKRWNFWRNFKCLLTVDMILPTFTKIRSSICSLMSIMEEIGILCM